VSGITIPLPAHLLKNAVANVRFGSKATFAAKAYVRFTANSGHVQCKEGCPLCAISGHSYIHSITLSARRREARTAP